MIKRITEIGELSCVDSPIFPLIYSTFLYPANESDGVFKLTENDGEKLIFSMKNGSVVLLKINTCDDFSEFNMFLSFWGIKEVISDFKFSEKCLEYPLLSANTQGNVCNGIKHLSCASHLDDYKRIYFLLNSVGENFEQWFSLFSRKINKNAALCCYIEEEKIVKSVCTATAVYKENAVISGVATNSDIFGKGYGTRCVKGTLSHLNNINVKNAFLWCEEKTAEFYKKMNFTQCGAIYICEEF